MGAQGCLNPGDNITSKQSNAESVGDRALPQLANAFSLALNIERPKAVSTTKTTLFKPANAESVGSHLSVLQSIYVTIKN